MAKSKISPTVLFFNFEIAVSRGNRRAAERAAAELRRAGFEVRHVTSTASKTAAEVRPDHFVEDALANLSREQAARIKELEAKLSMIDVKYRDLQHAVLLACPKIQDGLNQLRALQ